MTTVIRLIVLLSLSFVGCASQPPSRFPVLQETAAHDDQLDCAGIDDEILKANAIRDAIFEEYSDMLSQAALETATHFISHPVEGLFIGALNGLSTSKPRREYREAAAAAELRMIQLLIYKERERCPGFQTLDSCQDDASVLAKLRELELGLRREEITEKEYLSARHRVLDDLR